MGSDRITSMIDQIKGNSIRELARIPRRNTNPTQIEHSHLLGPLLGDPSHWLAL